MLTRSCSFNVIKAGPKDRDSSASKQSITFKPTPHYRGPKGYQVPPHRLSGSRRQPYGPRYIACDAYQDISHMNNPYTALSFGPFAQARGERKLNEA